MERLHKQLWLAVCLMGSAMGAHCGAQTAQDATSTQPQSATPQGTGAAPGTVTGVPRYRAGFRGRRGTSAPVSTAEVSITGKGDHTGTGGGTGTNSATLNVPQLHNALGVPSGTMIQVRLHQAVDSAHVKNGDMLDGTLAAPLGKIPAGAPVRLTVVAAARAGQMSSAGEISVQVIKVNGENLLSNVITAEGHEGQKLLSDDAPARGTEASFDTNETILLPAA